ncbi:hypothetical protein GUJ93_ZPchr0006g46387 [Zizania palustris]|uniref:Oberon coiled-coil region domain-containing protein n=1 Tax=Zizania palustris TaxID=103762 RepID=A0A8J5SXC8_ZIZPA|nr:hypothetical protein GUJ93_ZPchr0006g46387 [Zizania palustris]
MKRQSSYGDELNDDRRRLYDRGPPPLRRRPGDYDGDGFDRRKGFGSGFYDHRNRESPSSRGYGGDRAMHRSESFSGFRREFPKGFRSEHDRSRRDEGGSSAWRRQGGGWRDSEGLDGYRSVPRRTGASPPTPPLRSPSVSSRRLEGSKAEKSRRQSFGICEMEEGEVALDPEPKARPAAVEHRKQVESGHAKEKGPERSEVKKVESGVRVNLGTRRKGVAGASAADNGGKEEGKNKDGVTAEAGKVTNNTRHEKPASDDTVTVGRGHDEAANVVNQVGKCTSSSMKQDALQEEMMIRDEASNAVDVIVQSTSSSIQQEAIRDETANAAHGQRTLSSVQKEVIQAKAAIQDETANDIDEAGHNTSSSIQKEAIQENATIPDETVNDVDEVGQASSSTIDQGLQEEAVILDEVADAADVIGTVSLSGMHQEVLQEKVSDQASNDSDWVKIGTSLQATTQEEMTLLDGTANAVEPENINSGMLKEMIEGELVLNRIVDTIDVVGESNSPTTLDEAMHGKVIVEEGCSNDLDITGNYKQSTIMEELVTEKVMTSPCQGAPKMGINEKDAMSSKKRCEPIESGASQHVEEALLRDHCENRIALNQTEVSEQEAAAEHETVEKEVKCFGLEAKAAGANASYQPTKECNEDSKEEGKTLNLIMAKPSAEDKGKGIAFDVHSKEETIGVRNSVGRSFDLALQPDIDETVMLKSTGITSVKLEDDTLTIGKLDLSLSLSVALQNPEVKCSVPGPESLGHATCSWTLPSSSFHTNSEGFTASISLTNPRTFVHNPSCSLTQQSLDNYEHSVGSKPLFQGVDKVHDNTRWPAQLSNESTKKRKATRILQNSLKYGHLSDKTFGDVNVQSNEISSEIQRHAGISSVLSPMQSRDSHDSGFENRHKRHLTRERSSSSLTRGEQQDGQQLVLNGAGVIERIVSKIVSEPLHHTGRMLEEMTSNSVTYLREAISEAIVDTDKRGHVVALQEALTKRAYYPEVVKYVMAFFSDDDSNVGSGTSVPLKGIPCSVAEGTDGIPSSSRKATWQPSVTLEGVPFLEKQGVLSTTPSTLRKFGGAEFQSVDSKSSVDELDGLIRLKQAESNMYQQRANDALKEAENLKHITMVKYARIEEHYAAQIAELHINELQEQRRLKMEELQVIERTHHQFVSMKTRMEDIRISSTCLTQPPHDDSSCGHGVAYYTGSFYKKKKVQDCKSSTSSITTRETSMDILS